MLRCAATNVKSLRLSIFSNYLSTRQSDEPKVHSFTSRLQSLADKSKNILMNRDPYCPPHDVESRIEALSQKLFNLNTSDNSQWKAYHFQNNDEKYKMFTACISEFKHHIANSYLHEINCIDDLIKYFLTPVETPDFLYKLTTDSQNNLHKLPSNLNIQLEPIRYNPNEDNFFKANAYPGRSTIVSNLAAAKKHPSYRVSRLKRVHVEYEDM